ncbi:MAG: hypothetical protein MCM46_05750 [Candidatus Manganitrophus sp. SB1]|nr:hypothetical protein [Candidatus Manganitrophus morganii]
MIKIQSKKWIGGIGLAVVFFGSFTASAQTYNSGSTGADGPLAPTANITLPLPPDGIFHFTTVNIPAGVIVSFTHNSANTPVTLLATGDVTIAGVISVNGVNGTAPQSTGPIVNPGGIGGPGGFAGGQGGARGTTNNFPSEGQGPGAGSANRSGFYGAPTSFNSLIPLFGGSGGGGGFGSATVAGATGGGGGGAIVIASSTKIIVNGAVTANGGNGYHPGNTFFCESVMAGSGSGGAIRLVAPEIQGTGSLQAISVSTGCGSVGFGLIRLEAFIIGFTGSRNPVYATSVAPGPVTAASNPALTNLPRLTISSVGSIASPSTPSASYIAADVALPQGTNNPVTVTLAAVNIPAGTVYKVRLIPQFSSATTTDSFPSTGTFASSTATANVTFPLGQISVLNAYASFTLPTQIASALPLIEGDPVERVLLASDEGEGALVLVTRSGKEFPAKKILGEERLAALWSGLFQVQ